MDAKIADLSAGNFDEEIQDEKPDIMLPEPSEANQEHEKQFGPDGQGTYWSTVSLSSKKSKKNNKPKKKRKIRSNFPDAEELKEEDGHLSLAEELMANVQNQIKSEVEEGGKFYYSKIKTNII